MIGNLRQFYPGVPVMTAVQYLAQRDELQQMGATHVVALAPEGALSFGHSVLDRLGIPAQQSDTIIASLKSKRLRRAAWLSAMRNHRLQRNSHNESLAHPVAASAFHAAPARRLRDPPHQYADHGSEL
jgi:voltage-gated potassium channel Kch